MDEYKPPLQLQTVYYLMWHLYLKKSGVLL